MHVRKKEMLELMENFNGLPDRLLKYIEILLLGKDASPYCYQDTMSYRRLAIALTTHCNLKCKWCYRLDPSFKEVLNKKMDLDVLKKIIRNTKGNFKMIHLTGLGEPFTYPDLREAVEIVREKTKNVTITTNSTLVSVEKIIKLVKAGLTHIEFSIDAFSMNELNEYRGVDLDKVVKVVENISEKTELDITINAVVSSVNISDLNNLVTTLKNAKNINTIHTIPLFLTSQLQGTNCERVSDEEYKELLVKLERDIEDYDLNWQLRPTSHGVSIDPVIELKRRLNICFTCFDDPYIDTEGFLCDCGRREFSKIADATNGFEKAMNSDSAIKYRENMLSGNYPEFCGKLCFLKDKGKK